MYNNDVLEFLDKIGVDNRFISIWQDYIFINNLKFSRFSRRKEELFTAKFKNWEIVRSKVFQKMCIRSSRILSKSLSPKKTVFIKIDNHCTYMALNAILESYTRKYGIKIIQGKYDYIDKYNVDFIASPLTLDAEATHIINQIIHGKKIEPESLNTSFEDVNIIYPLINIPNSWIKSWINKSKFECQMKSIDGVPEDLINFFTHFIPQVQENILKSATFVSKKN